MILLNKNHSSKNTLWTKTSGYAFGRRCKMKKLIDILIFVSLFLSSCSPINSTKSIITPKPSLSPSITPTQRPSIKSAELTYLYNGPSNTDFDVIEDIPEGASVYPLGVFDDFLEIEYGGQIGFGVKKAFEPFSYQLEQLSETSVPRTTKNLINYFYDPETTIVNGKAIIDNSLNDEFWGYNCGPMTISKPFSITMDLSQNGEFGGISLSGRIPSPGQQFWENLLTVYIGANGELDFRDGQSEESVYKLQIDGIKGIPFVIVFPDIKGKSLIFQTVAGAEISTVDLSTLPLMNYPDGLFPDGVLYFGPFITPLGKLTVNHLDLSYPPDGVYIQPTTTMRELADKKNILLGMFLGELYSGNIKFQDIVKENFNGATIDFEWNQLEPEQGKFDFQSTDPEVEFAIQNNLKITGLHLLWGDRDHLPDWLLKGNFTKDELINILHEYITTISEHYKGKIYIWSVANEYTSRLLYGGDFWYDKLGSVYVKMAFNWAHETDPEAILLLNQDGNESNKDSRSEVTSKMLSLVKEWKNEGVPIDAIGMQMHLAPQINFTIPSKTDVEQIMQQFSNLGLDIYITEFDINLHNVPGSQEVRFNYQANGYKQMFEACLETKTCKGFSIFGASDPKSWLIIPYPDSNALIFDKDYNPKPAYYELLHALQQ